MKDEGHCEKIYREITAMGATFMAHAPDIKICQKCPDFTPEGCNAYRRFRAESKAKSILRKA